MYICDLHTSLMPYYRAAGLPQIKCWLWVQNDTSEEATVQAHLILRINHQWPTSSPGHQHSILCGHLEERAGGAYTVHIHVHTVMYIYVHTHVCKVRPGTLPALVCTCLALTLSLGSPLAFHSRISYWSAKMFTTLTLSDMGIANSLQRATH